ncbi:hypothetical protein Hte_009279 [Hypoxylon texense]
MESTQPSATSSLGQSSGVQGPGVVMTFPASVWKDYVPDCKAAIMNGASCQSTSGDVQVLLDKTHPDRIILGVLKDIIAHHPKLRVRPCLYEGEPMIGLLSDDNQSAHGLSALRPSQTMSAMSPSIMESASPVNPQSTQPGSSIANTRNGGYIGFPLPYEERGNAEANSESEAQAGRPKDSHSSQLRGKRINGYLLYRKVHYQEIAERLARLDLESVGQRVQMGRISQILSDQWNRLPPAQKKFFDDKAKEEEGDLSTEHLAREYHEFLARNGLDIIQAVPEGHPMGLDKYNVPELYGTILASPSRLGKRKSTATVSSPPRKAPKTSASHRAAPTPTTPWQVAGPSPQQHQTPASPTNEHLMRTRPARQSLLQQLFTQRRSTQRAVDGRATSYGQLGNGFLDDSAVDDRAWFDLRPSKR